MPAYAPNFTARLRVRYHAAGANHSQTWRFPAHGTLGIGLTAAKDAVQAVYDHMGNTMYDDAAIISTSYAVEDTDIFLPTSPLTLAGVIATPVDDPSIKAAAVSFVGRTSAGQPAKMFFYGVSSALRGAEESQDFRIQPLENEFIDDTIAELNGFIAGIILCGSDANPVTWYPYANSKDMDYWVKRVRQGG